MIYIIGGQFNHDLQQLDQVMVDVYDPQSDSGARARRYLSRIHTRKVRPLSMAIESGW